MSDSIQEILQSYESITLEEMKAIRLMNRIDTKYLTTIAKLQELLSLAKNNYRVQEISGTRIAEYYTLYYDTPTHHMYLAHQDGIARRQKIRVRSYLDSYLKFLEIKNKNNKGRTDKKRISIPQASLQEAYYPFIQTNSPYIPESLTGQLENRFQRITLVNKALSERLTIDTQIFFHNLEIDSYYKLNNLVVIELKKEERSISPITGYLNELRIKPAGFSKYCIGAALTNSQLKQNRFKPKINYILKMINNKGSLAKACG